MYGRYVVIIEFARERKFLRYSKIPHKRTCVVGVQADVVLSYRVCDLIVGLNFYVCMDDMLLL